VQRLLAEDSPVAFRVLSYLYLFGVIPPLWWRTGLGCDLMANYFDHQEIFWLCVVCIGVFMAEGSSLFPSPSPSHLVRE